VNETYVVNAKTKNSAMSIGTQDPLDALTRAREMMGPDSEVTITDRNGNVYTVAELEANVRSGAFAKPDSAGRS
jgi:hypothetical protein